MYAIYVYVIYIYIYTFYSFDKKFISLSFVSHIKEHQSFERYATSYVSKTETSHYPIFITVPCSIISR